MSVNISIQFAPRTEREIQRRLRRSGQKSRLFSAVLKVFDKEGQKTAQYIAAEVMPKTGLKRRTGSLARSMFGRAVVVNGLPGMRVGILRGPSVAYAAVHEFGTKKYDPTSPFPSIRPVRAKSLAWPVNSALTATGRARYVSPRDYPGKLIFIPVFRGKMIGKLYPEKELKKAASVFDLSAAKEAYRLMRKVDLRPRRYLRTGVRDRLEEIRAKVALAVLGEVFGDV